MGKCNALQIPTPAAATRSRGRGIMNRLLTTSASLVLIDANRILDQQIHSTGQADSNANQYAPRGPAEAFIQPLTDKQTESDADRHFQSQAEVSAPVLVVLV